MKRANVPSRVTAVLACIAPLTPLQLALALDHDPRCIGAQLAAMHTQGRLDRVKPTAHQRRLLRGAGSVYALATRPC